MFTKLKYMFYGYLQNVSVQRLDKAVNSGDVERIALCAEVIQKFGRKALGYGLILRKSEGKLEPIQAEIDRAYTTGLALEALI